MNYFRAYREAEGGEAGQPMRFTASTEGVKRDGKDLAAESWNLDNYKRNPVVLWVHDYPGRNLPLGRADVEVDGSRLVADVMFDPEDEFARQVESKYRRGFLNAVSVGWDETEDGTNELLDISAVPVPADPDALMERQRRALGELAAEMTELLEGPPKVKRAAIPPHTTPQAEEQTAWDAGSEVQQADGAATLRRMHAWVDESIDADLKRAYKLPHHQASGEVVWRGVAAAMSRLLQAGTQIPDDDRRGVYNHLARHYEQFDREPPEFRTNEELAALAPAHIRGLFLEGEPDLFPELFQRAGAMLSARNRQDLQQAVELIQSVLKRATPAEAEDEDERADVPEWVRSIHQQLQMIAGDNDNERRTD